MAVMEDDRFDIPEQYRKMSVAQLDKEANLLLEQINKNPKSIKPKKTVTKGKREITFFIS